MRHVSQILLAELFGLLEAGDLHIVGFGPCRQLLGDVLHMFVLQLIKDLVRMHIARKDDRIDRFELVGDIFADHEECKERHGQERADGHTQHNPPHDMGQRHGYGNDHGRQQGHKQGRSLFRFDGHRSKMY